MKKAITYEAPDVTIYEIRSEGAGWGSKIYGNAGSAGPDGGYWYEDEY